MKRTIQIQVDSASLDEALAKAERLAELLREAQQIVSTMMCQDKSES